MATKEKERPIKVLQFIDGLLAGGKERQLIELLKAHQGLAEVQHAVVTMSDTVHYEEINWLRVQVYKVVRRWKKDPLVLVELYRICKSIRPKIIHCWESMCVIYAIPICKILNIRLVNGLVQSAPPRLGVNEWIRCQLTFPFSDAIVSNSFAGLDAYSVPKYKGICIHNGIDLARACGLTAPDLVRRRLEIPEGHVVGMVARFYPQKDYVTFLRAARIVLQKRKDVVFVAVGDGPLLDACRNLVWADLRGKIRFLGRQQRVEEIINVFDIGVLCTFYEGLPNCVLEYMALGKPVVATDVPGNREAMGSGPTGILVRPHDPEAVAAAILRLLDNPELVKQFGERGRKRTKEEFSLDRMGKEFLWLYERLLSNYP